MKLTVCKYLNERIGAPKSSSSNANHKNPGETVEIQKVVIGDTIDGNSIWYQSTDGFYYWSGGFTETNFHLEGCEIDNYNDDQQLIIISQLQEQAHLVFKNKVKGYLGCGFGSKNYDENEPLSLLVYVEKKVAETELRDKVITEICFWGFKILTDVIEIAEAVHHNQIGQKVHEKSNPTKIGGLITTVDKKSTGTRSLFVKRPDKNNPDTYVNFLLASYHVLLNDLILSKQISFKTTGQIKRAAIFPLNSSPAKEHEVAEGEYNKFYDYVAIEVSEVGKNEVIQGIPIVDYFKFSELRSLEGKMACMIGGQSGYQEKKILSFHDKIILKPHFQEFINVISTERMSKDGDSGAPVVEKDSNKLIGFVIGGNKVDKSFILPFYRFAFHDDRTENFEIIKPTNP